MTLDPQWLVDALALIICDKNLHVKGRNIAQNHGVGSAYERLMNDGRASFNLLNKLWADYDADGGRMHRDFLRQLMVKMGLLCPLHDCALVPCLLPDNEAADKASATFSESWRRFVIDFSDSFLPAGFFDRLVCILTKHSCIFTKEDPPVLSRKSALIHGFNTKIWLRQRQRQNRIDVRVEGRFGNDEALEQATRLIGDLMARMQKEFAKNLRFKMRPDEGVIEGNLSDLCETLSAGNLSADESERKVIVVSTPGSGPDGEGGFTFDVMGSMQVLCFWELVSLAYDWAGSTNCYPEDESKWEKIFASPRPPKEELFELVHSTAWFCTFKGQVKGAVRAAVLDRRRVTMVCIDGGPISQAEQEAMPGVREEILQDLIQGCNVVEQDIDVKLQVFHTSQDFERILSPDNALSAKQKPIATTSTAPLQAVAESPQLEQLQRQLRERDRTIAELRASLAAAGAQAPLQPKPPPPRSDRSWSSCSSSRRHSRPCSRPASVASAFSAGAGLDAVKKLRQAPTHDTAPQDTGAVPGAVKKGNVRAKNAPWP